MKRQRFAIACITIAASLSLFHTSGRGAKSSPVLCQILTHSAYNDANIRRQVIFDDSGGSRASVLVAHTELASKLDYVAFLNREDNVIRINIGGRWPGAQGAVHWVETLSLVGGRQTYIALGEEITAGAEKPIEITLDCGFR